MSRPTREGPVYVLGISGKVNHSSSMGDGHHPSAVLLKDAAIVAMAGEERFNRIKYAVGYFPYQAAKFCLEQAGIQPQRLDAIGWGGGAFLSHARVGGGETHTRTRES